MKACGNNFLALALVALAKEGCWGRDTWFWLEVVFFQDGVRQFGDIRYLPWLCGTWSDGQKGHGECTSYYMWY